MDISNLLYAFSDQHNLSFWVISLLLDLLVEMQDRARSSKHLGRKRFQKSKEKQQKSDISQSKDRAGCKEAQ